MSETCPICGGEMLDDTPIDPIDGRKFCPLLDPQLPKVWRLIELRDRKEAMMKGLKESGMLWKVLWKTFEDGTIIAVGRAQER